MKTWMILGAIALGLLIIGSVALVKANTDTIIQPVTAKTCTSCGNSCTAESNCGLATCGAVNGGKCTCGK